MSDLVEVARKFRLANTLDFMSFSDADTPIDEKLAALIRAQRLALLQSLLDEELNTHGGKSSAVGTWLRTRMEEEKARG